VLVTIMKTDSITMLSYQKIKPGKLTDLGRQTLNEFKMQKMMICI